MYAHNLFSFFETYLIFSSLNYTIFKNSSTTKKIHVQTLNRNTLPILLINTTGNFITPLLYVPNNIVRIVWTHHIQSSNIIPATILFLVLKNKSGLHVTSSIVILPLYSIIICTCKVDKHWFLLMYPFFLTFFKICPAFWRFKFVL